METESFTSSLCPSIVCDSPMPRAPSCCASPWRDVKIARVGRNGRRRETARLRLLAMRKFDP